MANPGKPTAKGNHRFQKKGFSFERLIRWFFASNAGLTILILTLIISFLLKEGLGFFPGYRRELEIYRQSGMEWVDISRKCLTSHETLAGLLNRAYHAQVNAACHKEMRRLEDASALYNFFTDQTGPTRDLIITQAADDSAAAAMRSALNETYRAKRAEAVSRLPASPSLTAAERKELAAALAARTPQEENPPPLVEKLTASLAAAREKAAAPLAGFRTTADDFDATGMDLSGLISETSESVVSTKEALLAADAAEKDRATLLDAARRAKTAQEKNRLFGDAQSAAVPKPDVAAAIATLMEKKPDAIRLLAELKEKSAAVPAALPAALADADADRLLRAAKKACPPHLKELESAPGKLGAWDYKKTVPLRSAISSFLTGRDWITGGEWQDFYGVIPLAVGSLMIAIVALVLAIPIGIGSAIYANQFASPREQAVIKPVIEFIQAIPSVVLGFLGILVIGNTLSDISKIEALQWIPGFPIDERLNIFTAGCLLALMSIPTIFSLAEDALNNVPAAYSEASEALGASKVQTVFRVMIPAAFSGILAAALLGLGRVIGETMVVLLVAGNRIKIPDFTAGIGAFFQPAHTLTGIIAQELGEVSFGSVHYRALFVVGILLFAVVLVINATAHRFVHKKAK